MGIWNKRTDRHSLNHNKQQQKQKLDLDGKNYVNPPLHRHDQMLYKETDFIHVTRIPLHEKLNVKALKAQRPST